MPPRVFVPQSFVPEIEFALPAAASRHLQVLRLQPGETVTLFNGIDGAEWPAEITRIGRQAVDVRIGHARPVDRELPCAVTLALGAPANDRMDALVEKAAELGARAIQPLVCERSVLRLSGARAESRRVHWAGVAAAASEQCGRTRVAAVRPVTTFATWLAARDPDDDDAQRAVLSFDAAAAAADTLADEIAPRDGRPRGVIVLSGPEGGLTASEEEAAVARGFRRVGLGPRVLRADTAPLAFLAWLAVAWGAARKDRR
ncbi:MAG: 16S rRNA (uracil(1498)-N(3))-methyltransferase [Caldimonas sp.]